MDGAVSITYFWATADHPLGHFSLRFYVLLLSLLQPLHGLADLPITWRKLERLPISITGDWTGVRHACACKAAIVVDTGTNAQTHAPFSDRPAPL